jgi:hypothetical protein
MILRRLPRATALGAVSLETARKKTIYKNSAFLSCCVLSKGAFWFM